MHIQNFVHKDNIIMLWEVISDEEVFKYLTRDLQSNVYQLFLNNIQGFFNNEKTKTESLVDLNKKYILLILNYIKKNYDIQPNKIKIYQEPVKESITFEEIQNNRLTKFENDLNQKREEFDQFINVKPPPTPEFADKDRDGPIKEMDRILKEMQAKRNYDIEQIKINNSAQVDEWLKPQETSLKTEKFNPEIKSEHSRFKFLNQEIMEGSKDKKFVSFSNVEEIKTFDVDHEDDDNIFSKLKKVSNSKQGIYESSIENKEYKENKDDKEDRIIKLERQVNNIFDTLDKILDILSHKS